MNTLDCALAFDAAVPHRDRLLNAEGMRPSLARVVGDPAIGLPSIDRVKYQPGRSLRVVYRATDRTGASIIVSCRTFASAGHSEQERFWVFPDDRRLRAVDSLLRPARLRSRLDGAWSDSRLAAYSPEKSVVVACLSEQAETIAYAKQYASQADAAFAEAVQRHVAAALSEDEPLRVPCVRGHDETAHILFSDVAPGISITALESGRFVEAGGLLGAALARLHSIEIPRQLPVRVAAPRLAVADAVSIICRVQPWLARSANDLAMDLEASVPCATPSVLLHGDVHLKNAFVHDGAVWLIDLDQAAAGSPAVDIGSVLALFRSRVAAASAGRHEEDAFAAEFLDGYAGVRCLPPVGEINWHTAAALLTERAVRAISRMRLPLLSRLDLLLEDARRLVRPGGAL